MTFPTDFRRRLIARTVAGVLALAGAFAPTAALAASEDDDATQQTIDPNQTQGTGRVIIDRGHVDFGPTLNTGEWIIEIHDDTGSPSYWRRLEDVVIHVDDDALLDVPDSSAYDFLGLQPGTPVWVIPQTQNTDVVWTGWNTQEPNVLDQLDLGTTLSIRGVDGPGEVSVYLQSGNFGDPDPLWSSRDPFPQESWIEVNTHTHANWVFSEPGIYLVDIQFDADLNTGENVSARDTLRFAVGDDTDTESAFGMTPTETSSDGDASDEAQESGDAEPQPESGDPADAGIDVGLVIWIVVGAVVVVLIAAVTIVVATSRNAKKRALAARTGRETR